MSICRYSSCFLVTRWATSGSRLDLWSVINSCRNLGLAHAVLQVRLTVVIIWKFIVHVLDLAVHFDDLLHHFLFMSLTSHTHTCVAAITEHTDTYAYVCMYIYIVCVCVCNSLEEDLFVNLESSWLLLRSAVCTNIQSPHALFTRLYESGVGFRVHFFCTMSSELKMATVVCTSEGAPSLHISCVWVHTYIHTYKYAYKHTYVISLHLKSLRRICATNLARAASFGLWAVVGESVIPRVERSGTHHCPLPKDTSCASACLNGVDFFQCTQPLQSTNRRKQ